MTMPRLSRLFPPPPWRQTLRCCGGRGFRSKAALDALAKASAESLVLYNYPSFAGAFGSLFARLYHSHLCRPLLILPFSSVHPFRAVDFKIEGLKTCYLIDFVGPDHFPHQLSQLIDQTFGIVSITDFKIHCFRVVVIDHHKSALLKVDPGEDCPRNLHLHLDTNKSSAVAAYDYFTQQLNTENSAEQEKMCLINGEDAARILMLIKYIEDANLRKWELPDIRAFNIGIRPMFAKLNCVTNPYIFDQLLKLNPADLIAKGSSIIKSRQDAAKKLLGKPFKIRLGKGFYGNCLGIRADGNSNLADEIGKELSIRSAAAGLRPIGAVVYMQRGILKMCLRSTDSKADTSEIAKAYGGGGNSFSSSFTIKMDEYNKWVS
ncbi:uncharacterized protein LOC116251651 isoform X2 [Nymphaea colorata]|uniref:uncharacterized protein LOC116251651 isoform X2 n=1 Tax=Nymphaea colorata TaxID=210225 RepID=UPI00214E3005|nr:uncharacterized protein LOC116251651 isoform X2 [Nymphaea colorata]